MWKFLREYIKTPDTIGAIAPSSRHLAAAMTAWIDFDKAKCIVEYGAGNVCNFLKRQGFPHADHIISGLPFTSLPEPVSRRILSQTQKAVGTKGVFTTFQYTLLRRQFLEEYFNIRKIVRIWRNLPPAYVLNMKLKCSEADINVAMNGSQAANSNNINCCREGL